MALLASSLAEGRWHKLILARPVGSEPDLQREVVRPLVLRGQPHLSFVSSHTTRDITKNLPPPDGLLQIRQALGQRFRNAHLHTPSEEFQLRFGKKGTGHLSSTRLASGGVAALAAPAAHDREKQRWIDITRPFLVALGVTTAQHLLVPAMARKWKQINKFVEIFAHALDVSALAQAKQLRVVDFGAGKGYLTFALHDWLRHSRGMAAEVSGIELRADLVEQGKQHIADLKLQGLQMQHGDVREFGKGGKREPMDVMIALHACDTATDHAIHLGLQAGAQIILCSPCCHKQLRPQLLSAASMATASPVPRLTTKRRPAPRRASTAALQSRVAAACSAVGSCCKAASSSASLTLPMRHDTRAGDELADVALGGGHALLRAVPGRESVMQEAVGHPAVPFV